jgi:hypothetical protein
MASPGSQRFINNKTHFCGGSISSSSSSSKSSSTMKGCFGYQVVLSAQARWEQHHHTYKQKHEKFTPNEIPQQMTQNVLWMDARMISTHKFPIAPLN